MAQAVEGPSCSLGVEALAARAHHQSQTQNPVVEHPVVVVLRSDCPSVAQTRAPSVSDLGSVLACSDPCRGLADQIAELGRALAPAAAGLQTNCQSPLPPRSGFQTGPQARRDPVVRVAVVGRGPLDSDQSVALARSRIGGCHCLLALAEMQERRDPAGPVAGSAGPVEAVEAAVALAAHSDRVVRSRFRLAIAAVGAGHLHRVQIDDHLQAALDLADNQIAHLAAVEVAGFDQGFDIDIDFD